MKKLTTEIIRAFIDGKRVQRIKIGYNCIGRVGDTYQTMPIFFSGLKISKLYFAQKR